MLRPCNNLILQRLAQVAEVVAVAGDAYDEVPVLLWMRLGRVEGRGVHDVKLDVVALHLEVRAHEMDKAVEARVVLQNLRRELLVE